MKVEKDGVVKTIDNEILARQYIAIGWKEVKEDEKPKVEKEAKIEKPKVEKEKW